MGIILALGDAYTQNKKPLKSIGARFYWACHTLTSGYLVGSAKAGPVDQGILQDYRTFSSTIKRLSRGPALRSGHMISLD